MSNATLSFECRYKILFLDVLFPLGVKKIIFVDADQVGHRQTDRQTNGQTDR